ncbi:MAG: hypothetical protein PHX21_08315 [bacterium]|nr:hypothetical protein [bacterium]
MKKVMFCGMLLIPLNLLAADDIFSKMGNLIIPFGIITYGLVLFTVISGLRGWQFKKHKLIAIIAVSFATIHAVIILLLRYVVQ